MSTPHTQHPGELLWSDYLDPLEVTVTQAAKALGVTRKTLSAILNGRQGISPEMSIRLSIALGTPRDAWARKQLEYDMARTADPKRVKRITPADYAEDL